MQDSAEPEFPDWSVEQNFPFLGQSSEHSLITVTLSTVSINNIYETNIGKVGTILSFSCHTQHFTRWKHVHKLAAAG